MYKTREEWLVAATEEFKGGLFKQADLTVPAGVKLSVGWPKGVRGRGRAIGQAWHGKAAVDGKPQVFISPELDKPLDVLAVLVHELIHTIYPDAGHKGPFKSAMKSLGLVGRASATEAGPELKKTLERLNASLGTYPHSALNDVARKKQGTRLVKCQCEECGYPVRVTMQWIETCGAPICPCNRESMELADNLKPRRWVPPVLELPTE